MPSIAVIKIMKIKLNSKLPSLTFIYKLKVTTYLRVGHLNISKIRTTDNLLTTLRELARTSFTNLISDVQDHGVNLECPG